MKCSRGVHGLCCMHLACMIRQEPRLLDVAGNVLLLVSRRCSQDAVQRAVGRVEGSMHLHVAADGYWTVLVGSVLYGCGAHYSSSIVARLPCTLVKFLCTVFIPGVLGSLARDSPTSVCSTVFYPYTIRRPAKAFHLHSTPATDSRTMRVVFSCSQPTWLDLCDRHSVGAAAHASMRAYLS